MNKILVIEEEPSIRFLYQEELADDGFEVMTAPGDKDCISLIQSFGPDVVVMGLRLGLRSGFDLLEEIKESCCGLPVIINTIYMDCLDDPRASLADQCVIKSPDITGLKNAITGIVSRKSGPAAWSGGESRSDAGPAGS